MQCSMMNQCDIDSLYLVLLRAVVILLVSCSGAAAQDIVLERIEPDPGQLPCPQQTVKYLCQVMVPSTYLIWTIPTGDPLEFDILSDEGDFRNFSDNVYSATLTNKMENDDLDTNRFFFSSTLLILETVNGSTITCTGGTIGDPVEIRTVITLSGPPDPPSDLEYDDSVLIETSVDLKWSRPSHTGGVPLMNYSLTASSSSGTLSVSDGREMVSYTTPGLVYGEVQVTAINYCGQQSQPASLNIPAEAPPEVVSLSVELNCEVDMKPSRPVAISWNSGLREEGVVYPTVETTVQLDPGNIACSNYSSNTCTVCISSAGFYSISITQTNVIGTSENEATFDLRPLVVEEESLDQDSLSVTLIVNRLCVAGEYTVLVTFGTRPTLGGQCQGQVNTSAETLSPGDSAPFSVDSAHLSLGADETFCYFINGLTPDDSGGGGMEGGCDGEGNGLSTVAVVAISVSLTLLVCLPVGVALGWCGGVWSTVRRGKGRRKGGEKTELGAIYEEPSAVVETGISLSDNQAYGQVIPQR